MSAGNDEGWRSAVAGGRLLVLERIGGEDTAGRREVRLAGVFDHTDDLAAAFQMIYMSRMDGSLVVSDGKERYTLFLHRGIFQSASSTRKDHRLGAILVATGLLSNAECQIALSEAEGQPLGNVLVRRGTMKTSEVYDGIRRQAETIFSAAIALPRGTFQLIAPLDMTLVPAMLHLDSQEMLMEGLRRLDEARSKSPEPPPPARPAASEGLHRMRSNTLDGADAPEPQELVVATYDRTIADVLAAVDPGIARRLRDDIRGILRENVLFRDVYAGVEFTDEGLDRATLVANAKKLSATRVALLYEALDEILFFALFAAGDSMSPEAHTTLRDEVARRLAALPSRGADK
jgi:hypothetical protein